MSSSQRNFLLPCCFSLWFCCTFPVGFFSLLIVSFLGGLYIYIYFSLFIYILIVSFLGGFLSLPGHMETFHRRHFPPVDLDHEPAYTPHPPPPTTRGILPHNFWVSWPSKYTVQVVCKWAVAVCVCGAGSNKCTIWNSKLPWPCLLATHLLWQKRSFPYTVLFFEQFNML